VLDAGIERELFVTFSGASRFLLGRFSGKGREKEVGFMGGGLLNDGLTHGSSSNLRKLWTTNMGSNNTLSYSNSTEHKTAVEEPLGLNVRTFKRKTSTGDVVTTDENLSSEAYCAGVTPFISFKTVAPRK